MPVRLHLLRQQKRLLAILTGLLLVTLHNPTMDKEYGPFHRINMIEYSRYLLPIHLGFWGVPKPQISVLGHFLKVLSDNALRRQLFGHHKINLYGAVENLFPLMVVNAWRENVEFMESRLEKFRHNAIASPSMDTFIPLTVVRRNIAHLEEALMTARLSLPFMYEWLDDDVRARVRNIHQSYDSLLERLKAMSTLLSNEIQLVIGSVTVQVRTLRCTSHHRY